MKVVIIITCHLPGVNSDDFDAEPVQFSRFIELFRNRLQIQLIFPLRRNLKRIRSVGQTFLKGSGTPMPFRKHARTCNISTYCPACGITLEHWHRQLSRLQYLRDGAGLSFTVKLFFLAFKQLLSLSSSKPLYLGTFRAITSEWSKYKHSLGTQKLLLDMVMPLEGIISTSYYPDYIVDEFLKSLGNILEGQTGPHIDSVVQKLHRFQHPIYTKALDVIARARALSS